MSTVCKSPAAARPARSRRPRIRCTYGAEDRTAPYSVLWDTTASANGSYQLAAVARDAAGNATTSAAVSVTVSNSTADTTAPTVSLTAPANNATVSGATVTLSA